jgi:hypothetical protein
MLYLHSNDIHNRIQNIRMKIMLHLYISYTVHFKSFFTIIFTSPSVLAFHFDLYLNRISSVTTLISKEERNN